WPVWKPAASSLGTMNELLAKLDAPTAPAAVNSEPRRYLTVTDWPVWKPAASSLGTMNELLAKLDAPTAPAAVNS
ncbi:hypothetical protein G7B13_29815, partial [Klebsiella pneumoniae]|nr:hypothetical protein [Klebsiella pneumoniae]